MKKLVFLILILSLFLYCGPKQDEVERIMEDGVEVVINHLEPYKLKDEPSSLTLEKLFIMDFEKDNFAEIGVPDVTGFDVDSEGNIYIWSYKGAEYFIFKFDNYGKYVSSFGRRGQGPGELEDPDDLRINERGEILISDHYGRLLVFLDSDGNFIKKLRHSREYIFPSFLGDEKILSMKKYPINEDGMAKCPIVICSTDFEDIAVLHPGYEVPNYLRAKRINGLRLIGDNFPPWSISKGLIYIGNQVGGYEILIFDFNGKLQKKIRKKYNPIPVPEHIKKPVLKMFEEHRLNKEWKIKEKVYFPDYMPPFQYFFMDEDSRLFVMTNEGGEGEKEYKYDIFNPDGVFIARTSLDNSGNIYTGLWGGPFEVKVKNDCLYYLRAKDNGYKELVVYKMIWE